MHIVFRFENLVDMEDNILANVNPTSKRRFATPQQICCRTREPQKVNATLTLSTRKQSKH